MITPHVASKQRSVIDGRTRRHGGYAQSQGRRKMIEGRLGWMKTVELLWKLRHRGLVKLRWIWNFIAAACKPAPGYPAGYANRLTAKEKATL